jgi:hypothetical protein
MVVPKVSRTHGFGGLAPGLADGGLLVVARHVVPLDPVRVEVVQDTQASLQNKAVLVQSLARLRDLRRRGKM